MNIAFIYYSFYPVIGGASVHGYNLAKELSQLGYNLFKINGEPDPHTTKLQNPVTGLVWMLRNCDLFYIRMDYFFNLRNLVLLPALLFGKKIIVELNSPSDELHLFRKSEKQIRRVDRLFRYFLKKVDSVVVVSEPIKEYCSEALGLTNIQVIENGGEIFTPNPDDISPAVKEKISDIKATFDRLVVWSGSINKMQDLETIQKIQRAISENSALLLIIKEEKVGDKKELEIDSDNLFVFNNLARKDVAYIISESDVGLAFYNDYSWSRWGFYNSSLKIYEFLSNGLLTITNTQGTDRQRRYPNFKSVDTISQSEQYIKAGFSKDIEYSKRTWKIVAEETSGLIENIMKN